MARNASEHIDITKQWSVERTNNKEKITSSTEIPRTLTLDTDSRSRDGISLLLLAIRYVLFLNHFCVFLFFYECFKFFNNYLKIFVP